MPIVKSVLISTVLLIAVPLIAAPGLGQAGLLAAQLPPPFVSGEIIVKFKPQVDLLRAQSLLPSGGLQLMELSPRSELLRVRVTPGREAEMIAVLTARPDIEFAVYNYQLYALETPNDPEFNRQWNLHNTGQTGGVPDADIDAPEAWDIHTGGSNVTIAIIDTGVYLNHEDLQANIWLNGAEIPANGLDDDLNGYVDDDRGYEFYNYDSNPDDDNGHGSNVAGIAAARGNNSRGIAGVSWAAKIMPLKILSATGGGNLYDLQEAIYYAVDNGADIINMSAGGYCNSSWDSVIQPALNYAVAQDVLLVAAAGNTGSNYILCPAAMPGVLAVGSTTARDERALTSNFGLLLDIVAPGETIYSTYPAHISYRPQCYTQAYCELSGTSMASPHVAGLAALLWSFAPNLFLSDVRSLIQATADDLSPRSGDYCAALYPAYVGGSGWDPCYGHGRINAYRGLAALVDLQTSPAQLSFTVDDAGHSFPPTNEIALISAAPTDVNWTATISPTVAWLSLVGPAAGTVSAVGSPAGVELTASRPPAPAAYGVYSTTAIISGATTAGQQLGARTSRVYLNYVPQIELRPVYLPFILKNAVLKPDLIIESLVAASQAVTVTIKNQGQMDVIDAFWLDVYFNPGSIPTLNQPWDTLASHGLVWGVTAPLPSGESLTLTTGGAYFFPNLSSATPLPAAVDVYGLVDSVNFTTSYGAVDESDETNNLFGAVTSTGAAGATSASTGIQTTTAASAALPPR